MITWHAAYTQPNAESKALEHLQHQGYQVYLPRYRRLIRHARSKAMALRPLFPRYLFVGLDRVTQRWRPIRGTIGIVGLVTCGEEPVPVAKGVIEALRLRESEGAFDQLSPVQGLQVGDEVRVTEGPFEDLIGRLNGMADRERVYVLLDFLGRIARLEIPALAVEAA